MCLMTEGLQEVSVLTVTETYGSPVLSDVMPPHL